MFSLLLALVLGASVVPALVGVPDSVLTVLAVEAEEAAGVEAGVEAGVVVVVVVAVVVVVVVAVVEGVVLVAGNWKPGWLRRC